MNLLINAGGHSGEAIPVPIPNTEVKLSYVDDTALQRALTVNCTFKQKKAGSYLLSRECSIIGARELDFRVRNGNGYCLSAMATGIKSRIKQRTVSRFLRRARNRNGKKQKKE